MVYPENVEEIRRFAKEIKLDVKYLLGETYEGKFLLLTDLYLPSNIVFNVGGKIYLPTNRELPLS